MNKRVIYLLTACDSLFFVFLHILSPSFSTLASTHHLSSLSLGNITSFNLHARSISSAASSLPVKGFPCCIATAPSTLALLNSQSQENSNAEASSSSLKHVAFAKQFLNPNPRFDWRPRARSQIPPPTSSLPPYASQAGTQENGRRNLPIRVSPPHINLYRGEPFFEKVETYQERYVSLFSWLGPYVS